MKESQRLRLLSGIGLLLVAVAAVVLLMNRPAAKPPPSAPGYYTGPMKSKGNPNLYGTDDGTRVPPPTGPAAGPAVAKSPTSSASANRPGMD